MLIFCRRIIINKPSLLGAEGPVLIACNHPNSFLDSVILDALFKKPVWSLARGDAFRNPLASRILSALKILPVYRTSEGVENLSENYKTFKACIAIFRKNGIVHIFSEGKCVNEWHLRPLKKGTARLATRAWEENIPLNVLPVGINYSSFHRFGKNIILNFGDYITPERIRMDSPDGVKHQSFNTILQQEMEKLVFEIPKEDIDMQSRWLELPPSPVKRILLVIPALVGWIFHAPLYLSLKWFTRKKAGRSDHFDSILTALLVISYPAYLAIITALIWIISGNWQAVFLLLILPFSAWAYTQLKTQLD